MPIITIELHRGPGQRHTRSEDNDLLVSDLISRCREGYSLPEHEGGHRIGYRICHDAGQGRRPLPADKSLRELHIRPGDSLYLERDDAAEIGVAPLHAPRATDSIIATAPPSPCQIELAPGCSVSVSPTDGLVLNRDSLLKLFPPTLAAAQQARLLLNLPSPLQYVSRSEAGHCRLTWSGGWYLIARRPVHIGSQIYDRDTAVLLEQTTTALLGSRGWPITIRIAP
jgi:hypothetical protein